MASMRFGCPKLLKGPKSQQLLVCLSNTASTLTFEKGADQARMTKGGRCDHKTVRRLIWKLLMKLLRLNKTGDPKRKSAADEGNRFTQLDGPFTQELASCECVVGGNSNGGNEGPNRKKKINVTNQRPCKASKTHGCSCDVAKHDPSGQLVAAMPDHTCIKCRGSPDDEW